MRERSHLAKTGSNLRVTSEKWNRDLVRQNGKSGR
jgi:hypothetical protein